jgi:hypothetical protein
VRATARPKPRPPPATHWSLNGTLGEVLEKRPSPNRVPLRQPRLAHLDFSALTSQPKFAQWLHQHHLPRGALHQPPRQAHHLTVRAVLNHSGDTAMRPPGSTTRSRALHPVRWEPRHPVLRGLGTFRWGVAAVLRASTTAPGGGTSGPLDPLDLRSRAGIPTAKKSWTMWRLSTL